MSKTILNKSLKLQKEKDFVDDTLRGFENLVRIPNFDLSFLTFWLGDECTKGKSKECDKNARLFIKLSKSYPYNFSPFYKLNLADKDSIIPFEIQNSQYIFIITLNQDTPGAFDVYYSDYYLGNPNNVYYLKVEAKDENDLIEQINQITKDKQIYFRYIGPNTNPTKYGLMSVLGKGVFGINYLAKNLKKEINKKDFYAVKFIFVDPTNPNDALILWEKERQCLMDVLELCKKGNVLCYKDSFVLTEQDGSQTFVIITDYLEGYKTLEEYLLTNKLTLAEAKDIYTKVIETKNELTDICISHSDLHTGNIMYNPVTKDVKFIDFGRCQTPEEEKEEWYGDSVRPNRDTKQKKIDWGKYSDEARLNQLRFALYNNVYGGYPKYEGDEKMVFNNLVRDSKPGCKRNKIII